MLSEFTSAVWPAGFAGPRSRYAAKANVGWPLRMSGSPALPNQPARNQNCEMNFHASGGTKAFKPSSPVEVPSSTDDGVCAPSNVHTLTG